MKQILLIIAFFMGIGLNANAQEYKKMFKNGRVWNYIVSNSGILDQKYITVTVIGDTVVDGRTRSKLHFHTIYMTGDNEQCKFSSYDYYNTAYEEDGKIYYGDGKEPLMDFSMHKGDAIGWQNVHEEDYIEVRGVKYRRLELYPDGGTKYYKRYWVEGIGASCCLAMNTGEDIHAISEITYLESCYDNGQLIFSHDDFYLPAITGIAAVKPSAPTDGKAYDLSGRRISQPAKNGIYIKDGHKHLQR